jgi:hypothetical protein
MNAGLADRWRAAARRSRSNRAGNGAVTAASQIEQSAEVVGRRLQLVRGSDEVTLTTAIAREGSGGGRVGDDSGYGEPPKIDIAPSPSWVSA